MIISYCGIQVTVIALDYKTDFLNINPQIQYNNTLTCKSFYYEFPPYWGPDKLIYSGSAIKSGLPLFSITTSYMFNDTLAVGGPFFYTASGEIFPEGQKIIEEVDLSFQGATYVDDLFSSVQPTFTVPLHETDVPSMVIPTSSIPIPWLPVKWNSEGQFHPYVHIAFNNGSLVNVDIDDGYVYVAGSSVLQQQAFTRAQSEYNIESGAQTIDAILLGILSPASVIGYILDRRQKRNEAIKGKNQVNENNNNQNKHGQKTHRNRINKKNKPKQV